MDIIKNILRVPIFIAYGTICIYADMTHHVTDRPNINQTPDINQKPNRLLMNTNDLHSCLNSFLSLVKK